MDKKNIKWIVIILIILLLVYYFLKQQGVLEKKSGANCFVMEEIHECQTCNGDTSWVSLVKTNDLGVGGLRPKRGDFVIGGQMEIKDTTGTLNGVYTIVSIYYDNLDDIGSIRIATPSDYIFEYNGYQGAGETLEAIDMTYFGQGKICVVS